MSTKWVWLSRTQAISVARALFRAEELLFHASLEDWTLVQQWYRATFQFGMSAVVANLDDILGPLAHLNCDHLSFAESNWNFEPSVFRFYFGKLFGPWIKRWRFRVEEVCIFRSELARFLDSIATDSRPSEASLISQRMIFFDCGNVLAGRCYGLPEALRTNVAAWWEQVNRENFQSIHAKV